MKVRTPEEVVQDLGPAYIGWKDNEKLKEKYRKEFMAAVTTSLDDKGELAEIVVSVPANSPEQANAIVTKEYPTWRVSESRPNPDVKGEFEFILEEDPTYKEFPGVEFKDKLWTRQVIAGSTYIDDERMLEKDLTLYMEVSEYENEPLIRRVITFLSTGDDPNAPEICLAVEAFFEAECGGKRVLRNLDSLDPDQLARVQPYLYEGKPTLKLPAPK